MPKPPAHMSPEAFRRHGHQMIDWIADYLQNIEQRPVLSRSRPGDTRALLPSSPPQLGQSLDTILQDVERIVMPGITHWQSPNFFAFFPANSSGPAILGDLLSSGLGVQGMLWATSPACTEVETHMLDWLVELLGLPETFRSDSKGGGVIQDTASSSTLCALLAARERATNFLSNRQGTRGELIAYTSSQAHSSVEKAAKIAGIGSDNLRQVDVDDNFAMSPAALRNAIKADKARGAKPFFVMATVGTTSSTAIDPIARIAPICNREKIWLHVDAALGGSAAVCPEFRWMQAGLENADSYCFNPHKWLLTNFDCDCFYVADRATLINTLTVAPEYLKNRATESGEVFDYRDWQVPLGRRFRALKLWFVIRHYGREGLRQHIRHHVHLAQLFAAWVERSGDFELSAPLTLNLVCFRHKSDDKTNERLLEAINATGKIYLTHTKLRGRYVLRMAIGATLTQHQHVEAAWQLILDTAASLRR